MCRHLLGERGDELDTYWVLRGVGVDYDLCCAACARAEQLPDLISACEGCVAKADGTWSVVGVLGEPEIRRRPEPVTGTWSSAVLPAEAVDVAPLAGCPGEWLLLAAGQLVRWHAGTGEVSSRWDVSLPRLGPELVGGKPATIRVHPSPDGEYAAIAVDYRQYGIVVELAGGRVVMELDRGGYHVEQTPFPLAFLCIDGRWLLAHATTWNRVDLSDPATGVMITPRQFPAAGRERPARYLDYFYGALHPSPDGRLLVSDGWVWHPVGMPRVWDAWRWRHDNVYEPEDGDSARTLRQVGYYWDHPMCWLDDTTLALSGIGTDDEAMIGGVQLYDANSAAPVRAFAGPVGQLYGDRGRLYSASPDGLQIWDVRTGDNTGTVPGFVPSRHHPGSHEFAAIDGITLTSWQAT